MNTDKFNGYMTAFLDAQKAIIEQLRMVTNEDTRQALFAINKELEDGKKRYIEKLGVELVEKIESQNNEKETAS